MRQSRRPAARAGPWLRRPFPRLCYGVVSMAAFMWHSTRCLTSKKKGLSPKSLVAKRPGLVILDYRAWGLEGDWRHWGGFDQLASSATGMAIKECGKDHPKLPPSYLLNDSLAAVLGTAGVMEALRRRTIDGGSYHVHVDLARISMWTQDIGLYSESDIQGLPLPPKSVDASELGHLDSDFGKTVYFSTPIRYSAFKPNLKYGATPLGKENIVTWIRENS